MSGPDREGAAILWARWSSGGVGPDLPASCRPADLDAGYAAQALLPELSGQAIHGWKIAATNPAGQAHIGVTAPIAGRLLAERVLAPGAAVALAANRMRVAEAEFAFSLGADLPPRERPYRVAEVLDAVAALHVAIELPDSRFEDFARAGAPQLAADDACASWFVAGAAAPRGWRDLDLAAHPVVVTLDGAEACRGTGADVLGDPRAALTWIANNHAAQRDWLRAGQIVTTGVCGRPVAVRPGNAVHADFGALGSIGVRFVD